MVDHPAFIERKSYVLDFCDTSVSRAVAAEDEIVRTTKDAAGAGPRFTQPSLGNLQSAFGDWVPLALEPVAILVGHVALLFPLRTWWEKLRIVSHVELTGVFQTPAAPRVIAEQHTMVIHLLQDPRVPLGTKF